MNKHIFISILISIILLGSCRNSNNSTELLEFPENSSIANDLKSDEARVYSLPSPYQVSAIIKLSGIKYQSDIVAFPLKQTMSYSSPEYKSLNLGISLVDLYYTTVYEQFASTLIFMKKVDNFMYELGLKNQNLDKLQERVEKNYLNKDSLIQFMSVYQQDFEKYYSASEEKQKTFLIVGGIYIEGLYTLSQIYKESFQAQTLSMFMEKNFNSSILQQSVFLDNLIEILSSYNDARLDKTIKRMQDLQRLFETINIEYNVSEKSDIKDVKIKMKDILQINELASKIREEIILEKL